MRARIRSMAIIAMFLATVGVVISVMGSKAVAQIGAALVKNADEPGRVPYQQTLEFGPNSTICLGGLFCVLSFPPVPSGKRLVVEQVSALIAVSGGQVHYLTLGDQFLTNGGNVAILQPNFVPAYNGRFLATTQQVRAYYEPEATPKLKIAVTNGFSNFRSNVTLTGYLIDATN
jgi:hypothetical protein